MRLGVVRFQFQRPAVAGERFVELPLFIQRHAEVVVRLGEVRLQFQRPAVAGDRFVQLLLVLQHVAEVVMRLGEIRLQFHRPAAAGGRFVQLSLVPQGDAQAIVRVGIVRVQGQCPAVAGDRFGDPAQGAIGLSQVAVEEGHVPFQGDCPFDVCDGYLVFPHLVSNQAEEMRRVGMIRLDCENLPVELLGRMQPTALMVLDRHRQCFGNCRHGVYYEKMRCASQCEKRIFSIVGRETRLTAFGSPLIMVACRVHRHRIMNRPAREPSGYFKIGHAGWKPTLHARFRNNL